MNELIKIKENNGKKAVSARELYSYLTDDSEFKNINAWMKRNISSNKLATENIDYQIIRYRNEFNRNLIDFALSIDFSKELCMLSQCEKGKQARQYFIECEKQLSNNVAVLNEAQMILNAIQLMQNQQISLQKHDEKLMQIESKLEAIEQKQSIEIKQDYFTILAYCRIKNIPITYSEAIQKGKIATKLSKEKGLDLRKTPDERYGYVNSYNISVLNETFQL